jgi:hypothetical protein
LFCGLTNRHSATFSTDDRPSRALAGLLVAVALVGLVVCLVTADIARANFSVCGLRVGYDR